jgi:predicted ATPase/class 3 adenylate cyclase
VTERTDLPGGIVTFLFTDIEGSTRILQQIGSRATELFDTQAGIVRTAVGDAGGVVVNTEGDAFFCVFTTPVAALAAAAQAQRGLHAVAWPLGAEIRIRIGIHTGIGSLGGTDYQGIDVHRAARIADAGHGGQVVVSLPTVDALDDGWELHPGLSGVEILDLGLHRLKDLVEPERLYELKIEGLPSAFPALRTIATNAGALPERLDAFIGRSREIDELTAVLATHRLVTCTGPGGVGKTRLATAVARRVASDHDRVAFVPLAPLDTPDAVAPAILRALGVPPSSEPAADRLPGVLADTATLLVLDNFEHVLDATSLIADLLRLAPATSILATSRATLRIGGEREFPVPPLATGNEAVELFVTRAKAIRPDLELSPDDDRAIGEITERLGGLPLAIELAAARVSLMSPAALRSRMTGVLDLATAGGPESDPRQRTLRDTIRWSYDLLTAEQRRILDELSVFRGGATLDSIEAVTRQERPYWEWLQDVELLDAHSLVTRAGSEGDARFIVPEMIREFGVEQLNEAGAWGRAADRHFEWFLGLAERAAGGIRTRAQGVWLATLEDERANLQAALSWAMERGDATGAARLVYALWRFWHMRGPIPEGEQQVGKVLAMEQLEPQDRLLALEADGGLAWWAGDIELAGARYQETLAVARDHGTAEQLANALYNAGLAADFRELGSGRALLEEGIEVATAAGDVQGLAQCRWGISAVPQFEHDFAGAHEHLCAALQGFEEVGDAFMQHWTTRELGTVEMELGRMDESKAHLRQSLDFFAEARDRSGTILVLRDHARIAALEGNMDRALRILGAAAAAEAESGLRLGAFELEALGLPNPVVLEDQTAAAALRAEGASWSLEKAVAYAKSEEP